MEGEGYRPAEDALEKYHAALQQERIAVPKADLIFDFVVKLREVFAERYKSGVKLPLQEFAKAVPDPGHVVDLCAGMDAYTKPQLALFIAASIICKSKEAARSLGACVCPRAPANIGARIKDLDLSKFL